MSFCLNVLRMDASAFSVGSTHRNRARLLKSLQDNPQVFTLILALALVTHQVTIEHEYASALMRAPASRQWFLLLNFPLRDWTPDDFMADRSGLIDSTFCAVRREQALTAATVLSVNIYHAQRSPQRNPAEKAYMYQVMIQMVGAMQLNYNVSPAIALSTR